MKKNCGNSLGGVDKSIFGGISDGFAEKMFDGTPRGVSDGITEKPPKKFLLGKFQRELMLKDR